MPKVYITQEQRDCEKIKKVIRSRMAFLGYKDFEVAEMLGLSRQTFSYRILHGAFSLPDFVALHRILHFTAHDLEAMIGRFGKKGFND